MRVIRGNRVGKDGRLSGGCAAAIFDKTRQSILLTRRTDNGRWCLPGGRMESGESAAECCAREILEETGLQVQIVRLVGVYSSPHWIVEYADGNRYQLRSHCFEAKISGGMLQLCDETTEYGYFTQREIQSLDVIENHRERIADVFAQSSATVAR